MNLLFQGCLMPVRYILFFGFYCSSSISTTLRYCYLCHGVVVSVMFVCLFVSRIMQKLVDRFSQILVERWHIDRVRNR